MILEIMLTVSPQEISGENILVMRWLKGEVEEDFWTLFATKEFSL